MAEAMLIEATRLRRRVFNIWRAKDSEIITKFNNINGKTAIGDVPPELFQKRTSRTNRVLLPFKVIKNNQLEISKLNSFAGGVCVELVNYDLIDPTNFEYEGFTDLLSKIGSDELVSAMISFRSEEGDSGANAARSSYSEIMEKIVNGEIDINLIPIERDDTKVWSGKGDNSVWKGNFFAGIRGGQQTGIESHKQLGEQLLFNPAIEYANPLVCEDINLVLSYFALHCHDISEGGDVKIENETIEHIKKDIEDYLKSRQYNGCNLLDYCMKHPSLFVGEGVLIDPIQFKKISINFFNKNKANKMDVMNLCHDESVDKKRIYFDNQQQCLLTPARPNNFFWATNLSNMMQQNYTLKEYYQEEDERYRKRKEKDGLLNCEADI
jgi:hypothetical protein